MLEFFSNHAQFFAGFWACGFIMNLLSGHADYTEEEVHTGDPYTGADLATLIFFSLFWFVFEIWGFIFFIRLKFGVK
jgi:hypothetical protein